MPAVVLPRADLPFPGSLPEFQRLFPDDTACAAYLEAIRWRDGFVCGWCGEASEPYRFANRPQVLRCRKCQRDNALTAGTVMERTRTPLSIWFWAAYLVSSHTPGISAVQFQRQLGLNRYETAFQILHKLRAGRVRPGRDRIGGQPGDDVGIDEAWVGGRTRGEGRGVHDQAGRRWPRRMTGCTPVHGNIQNATAKASRASSELGYRQNRHQIWCSWVSTGQAWTKDI